MAHFSGGAAVLSVRFVVCAHLPCRQVFFVCSGCDRGQAYCGRRCRDEARRRSVREAGRRFALTRPGRFGRADRQRRHRERAKSSTQKVTHQGVVPSTAGAMVGLPFDLAAAEAPRATASRATARRSESAEWPSRSIALVVSLPPASVGAPTGRLVRIERSSDLASLPERQGLEQERQGSWV